MSLLWGAISLYVIGYGGALVYYRRSEPVQFVLRESVSRGVVADVVGKNPRLGWTYYLVAKGGPKRRRFFVHLPLYNGGASAIVDAKVIKYAGGGLKLLKLTVQIGGKKRKLR